MQEKHSVQIVMLVCGSWNSPLAVVVFNHTCRCFWTYFSKVHGLYGKTSVRWRQTQI